MANEGMEGRDENFPRPLRSRSLSFSGHRANHGPRGGRTTICWASFPRTHRSRSSPCFRSAIPFSSTPTIVDDTIPLLPQHSVGLVLQYICPPSQLTEPLPPHLLSSALSQRHHFLGITPTEPLEYLSWPTSANTGGTSAVEVLEALPRLSDDVEGPTSLPVRYSADDEHVYAHATIKNEDGRSVRLVFQWDGEDAWRYHDASTAPLQFETTDSPSSALLLAQHATAPDSGAHHHKHSIHARGYESPYPGEAGLIDDEAGDFDYWNSYGGGDVDDSEPPSRRRSSLHSKPGDKGEDAYWAQYGTVHGEALSCACPSALLIVVVVMWRRHSGFDDSFARS
jgi:hypothetical protein